MSATGTCPQGLPVETVGPYFEAYTTGYSDSFLAYGTLEIEGPGCTEDVIVGGFHTIDFSNLYYNPISPTTTYKAGCAPYVNPRVSMALDLTAAVPAWVACQPLYYGAFDPPSILHKENQLAPPTPAPAPAPAPHSPQSAPQPVPAPAIDTPPNPPADLISAPENPATQSNPIPPNAPGNPSATPPAKPQDPPLAPSTDPGQPAPANTPYNPNSLTPEQAAGLNQALGNSNPAPNNPTPNNPAPNNPTPNNPAPNDPAPNNPAPPYNPASKNPGPDNPAPKNPATAPIPLQTIPNNPPATQAPTKLQALPINPPTQGNPPPVVQGPTTPNPNPPVVPNNNPINGGNPTPNPGQPQNNVNKPPTGSNENPAPANPPQPTAVNNGPPQPGQQPGPNFPAAAPAVALPIATAPVYLGITQPLAVGGQAVQKAPDGGLLIGGQSVTRGSQATVAGQIISVGASNVAVGSNTYAFPAAIGPNPVGLGTPAPLSIGGQAAQYAPGPNGGLLIAGQTIAAGQQATVSGSVISVGASALNVGGSTYALPSPTPATAFGQPAPPVVSGQAIQQASGGGVIIAGQTIAQGSQATVQGTVISVGSTGVVIAGSSYTIPTPTSPSPLEYIPATVSIGNAPISQLPSSALLVAGQTLTPGATTTISGTAITLGTGNVVLDGSTFFLPSLTGSTSVPLQTPARLLIAGNYASEAPNGGIIVAGQTLNRGAQTTISGTPISVLPTGGTVIVNGVTQTLLNPTSPTSPSSIPPNDIILTSGAIITNSNGKSVTYAGPAVSALLEGNSELVIGSATLALGGSVTGLPVVSEKAVVAGIIYSALGSDGGGRGGNGTGMNTSIGTVGGSPPSGTAGAGVNLPTVIGAGRAVSDAVGLRKYSAFVIAVVAGMVGILLIG